MESGELRPNGITIDITKAKQLCNEFANKTFEQYNFMSTRSK
ncbi:hypothetical protein P4377_20470 [Bacillus thuringiensis]|nr:hypothetical protein [Bacillus thuringiensis]